MSRVEEEPELKAWVDGLELLYVEVLECSKKLQTVEGVAHFEKLLAGMREILKECRDFFNEEDASTSVAK
jgi:hypothetical protein